MYPTFGPVGREAGCRLRGGFADPYSWALSPLQLQGAQRKLQEQESEFRARERDLLGSVEEARGARNQQLDHARSLGLKLEAARAEAADLGLRLSAAEGRAIELGSDLPKFEKAVFYNSKKCHLLLPHKVEYNFDFFMVIQGYCYDQLMLVLKY